MDEQKLVSLVQKSEILYDQSNADFKNVERKNDAWMYISNQLDCPAEKCIKRWTSLRDQFTRECRERLNGNSQSKSTKWQLWEAMDFLKPHIRYRAKRTKNKRETTTSGSTSEEFCDELPEYVIPLSPSESPKDQDQENPLQHHEENISPLEFEESFCVTKEPNTKKRKISDTDEAFLEAVNCFKALCEREETRFNAAIEGFGQMLMATINDMSSTKQRRAMRLITEIIMNIKDEPE